MIAPPKGFRADRPEILSVLISAEIMQWGSLITFNGTVAELIATGVATEETFAGLGKTGVKTADDGLGNKYKVQRRPKGLFDLECCIWSHYGDPLEASARKLLAWKTHGSATEAIVSDALARMRRGMAEQL